MEIGNRYGHLIVTDTAAPSSRYTAWLCRCDCGAEKVVRQADLRSGNTTSCGCWTWHKTKKHGRYKDPLYQIYHQMRARCRNPKHPSWANYGGKGISVDPAWDTFAAFEADMGPRPSPKHSLDRIDGNGDYAPGNVRWATQSEQMQNIRTNVLITAQGKTASIGAWSRMTGIPNSTLQARIARGWDHEAAVIPGHPRKHRKKAAPAGEGAAGSS